MDKTYVFDGGASSESGLLASIIPALQNRGVDSSYLLGMLNNGGNGGLFGGRGFEDIIALIIVAAIFGNGNFGFGNNNGASSAGTAERELLSSMIQRNGVDLNTLASTLHCSVGDLQNGINSVSTQICNLASQNGQSALQIINAIQAGDAALTSRIADCCCENRLAICQQTNTLQNAINSVAVGQERGFSSVAYAAQQQTCDITKAIADSTAQVLAGQRAAEQRELQDKIDALREKNSQQATFINNAQQTAAISAMISPISAEIEKLKCKLPDSVTIPYSPVVGVPSCAAYQLGLYGGLGYSGYPYGGGVGFFG